MKNKFKLFIRLLCLALVLTLFLGTVACNININIGNAEQKPTNKYGNSYGNLNNNYGIATMQDDWIYYATSSGIYKINVDGTGNAQLYEGEAIHLNAYDEWLYFRKTGTSEFYRMKTDGTGLELYLPKARYLYCVNGYIYYVDYDSEYLCRMRPDKSEHTVIIEQKIDLYINITEDSIYWGDNRNVNVANLDGTDIRTYNKAHSQGMLIYEGYKYTSGSLTKSDINGENKVKLVESGAMCINISDGWIYFSNTQDNYSVYKIKTDGTSLTKLNDVHTGGLCVVGDWIYYYTMKEDTHNKGSYYLYRYYKMRIDGSENTEVL